MSRITKNQQLNLLTSALEGGSNDWYSLSLKGLDIPAKGYTPKTVEISEGLDCLKDCLVSRLWEFIQSGGTIEVKDCDNGDFLGSLSKKSFAAGSKLLSEDPQYKRHLQDVLNENDDALTGDTWLQLVVMGLIVYG